MDHRTEDQTTLAGLADRLAGLEAERAVLDTLYRYGHSIDYGDREAWLDCFTDDGVFELTYPQGVPAGASSRPGGEATATGTRYAGTAALTRFINDHSSAPAAWHKHFLVEPRVVLAVDRATATVTSYFARLDDRAGQRVIMAFGRYRDDLAIGDDGRWRFRHRLAEIESLLT
jgi:hypothetical protein